jgi:hypothetical protein
MAATCELLMRFCLAAITTPGQGQVSAEQIAALLPPSRHAPLLKQAKGILASHLTGLHRVAAPEVNLQSLINTIIAGQQQRQQEQAIAHLDRKIKDNTAVATWLGVENFARLLQYCGVNKEQEWAPLWLILVKAPTKSRLTIFKGKVANEFLALGAIYEQFASSLFLLTQVTSLKWGMLNPDALESGLLGNAFLLRTQTSRRRRGSTNKLSSSSRAELRPPIRMPKSFSKPRSTCLGQTTVCGASVACWLCFVRFSLMCTPLSPFCASTMVS